MRAGWIGVGVVACGWSLACAGPGGETTIDAPVDGSETTDAPTDATPPEAGDETVTLTWLAEEEGKCTWKRQDVPGGEPTTLASLEGTCPKEWRIAAPPAASHIVIYGPRQTWVVDKSGVRSVAPAKDDIDLVATDGETIWGCSEVGGDATDKDGVLSWVFQGKTYTVKDEGVGGVLVRNVTLGEEGWVEKNIVAKALHEGEGAPHCDWTDGWPQATKHITAAADPDEVEFREATDAEREQLKPFEDGSWHLSKQGGVASRTEWLEGLLFLSPVVSRSAESAPWTPVPELGKTGDAHYDVSGPFLLINTATGSLLRDVRTGTDVWTAPVAAVFLRKDVPMPEMPSPIAAEPGEPSEPEEEPATDGAVTPKPRHTPEEIRERKAKMKAKMKAKVGG